MSIVCILSLMKVASADAELNYGTDLARSSFMAMLHGPSLKKVCINPTLHRPLIPSGLISWIT